LTARQRKALADLVIEHIYDRTDRGLDVNGKRFKAYSKGYAKSLDFSIAGKSKGRVNLQLSGDMLAAMTLLEHEEGRVVIGFEDSEREKAEGNILGSYGGDQDSSKARKFFGIKPAKLRELIDYVSEE